MIPADDELSCKEVVGLVTEYLESALLPAAQARFEEHVADCPGCQAYIQQIQQTIAMLRKLAEDPLFPETSQQLRRLFQTWKNTLHSSE